MTADEQGRVNNAESGQAAMWLTLTVAAMLVALAVSGFSRIATAADQDSQLQVAADAAALAGAQSIVSDAHSTIVNQLQYGRVSIHSLGSSKARELAGENGATVSEYRYDAASDEVRVTVTSKERLESGDFESAKATAEVGKKLLPCKRPKPPAITIAPTPTASPSPGVKPPKPPKPPKDIVKKIRCGDLPPFDITFPGTGGPSVIDWNAIGLAIDNLNLRPTLKK